jgi:arylformamidase
MPIYKKDIEGKIEGYKIIVLHAGNGYLTKEAAEYIVEAGVKTVVIDYWSIAPLDNEKEIHEIILGNDIAVVENVILEDVKDGEYTISAFPIKIEGCDGAFVRAVLIEE